MYFDGKIDPIFQNLYSNWAILPAMSLLLLERWRLSIKYPWLHCWHYALDRYYCQPHWRDYWRSGSGSGVRIWNRCFVVRLFHEFRSQPVAPVPSDRTLGRLRIWWKGVPSPQPGCKISSRLADLRRLTCCVIQTGSLTGNGTGNRHTVGANGLSWQAIRNYPRWM